MKKSSQMLPVISVNAAGAATINSRRAQRAARAEFISVLGPAGTRNLRARRRGRGRLEVRRQVDGGHPADARQLGAKAPLRQQLEVDPRRQRLLGHELVLS